MGEFDPSMKRMEGHVRELYISLVFRLSFTVTNSIKDILVQVYHTRNSLRSPALTTVCVNTLLRELGRYVKVACLWTKVTSRV